MDKNYLDYLSSLPDNLIYNTFLIVVEITDGHYMAFTLYFGVCTSHTAW